MRFLLSLVTALAVWIAGAAPAAGVEPPEKPPAESARHFDRHVAPLLASYCLDCHQGAEAEGGLNLARRATALSGGESGPAIQPGSPEDSLLWRRIESGEMPPKEALPAKSRDVLRAWIADGARWGSDPIDPYRFTTEKRAGLDWWSLQPLDAALPPKVRGEHRVRNPIDRFLLAALEQRGLSYSAEADPRTLVRRLYFDLTGLPPEPELVETFYADGADGAAGGDAAYARLVDRLLQSPAYGERWARHWLDVARWGESDGFERNNPRTNFWPYRDWVIEAFNNDLPYDRFVRMQIAGDVLLPGDPEGVAAAGFLVAGVHNTVVGSSEMMRRQARQDELEEITGAVGQAFLGLTVHCGRCHDHKFDPIRQEEYYRLTAALAGVRHGEREMPAAETEKELGRLEGELAEASARLRAIEDPVRRRILARRAAGKSSAPQPPAAYAHWDFDDSPSDRIGSLDAKLAGGAKLADGALVVDGQGYAETPPVPKPLAEKTLAARLQLDTLDQAGGAAISLQTAGGAAFDAIVFGEREPRQWMAGSDFFRRTQSFGGPAEDGADTQPVHIAIVYEADGTIRGYRNGQAYGEPYKSDGPRPFAAGTGQIVFGLRHAPPGGNRLLRGRILEATLYDRALSPEAVAAAAGASSRYVAESEIVQQLTDRQRVERAGLLQRRDELLARRNDVRAALRRTIYTVTPATPEPTFFLARGDVMSRGQQVTPGGVAAIAGVNADFQLPEDAPDAARRKALAHWIADRQNPLLARVIVNRLWHHHFGTGIVDTPSDFGFNGGRPSHPKLLDWLAAELVRHDYRLKPIHRLIVTSSAYRQASRGRVEAQRIDAGNRLLWRYSPRRMEAEVLRDSLLSVSGRLNRRPGGPGFQDVEIAPNNGTTYYVPIDREDEELNRRTIYRFWPRGGRSSLLDTFDCPDPSATAPRRSVTTTPLQALSLLNDAFVLRMADHFARRVEREVGKDPARQVERSYALIYNRPPDQEERSLAGRLVQRHGLATLARALLNSNEFVVIE